MEKRLRAIKKIDKLAELPEFQPLYGIHSQEYILKTIKAGVSEVRKSIQEGLLAQNRDVDQEIIQATWRIIEGHQKPRLQRVLNCTGTVLHTNLGRATLSPKAREAVASLSDQYTNVELNLATGKRGSRYDHILGILKELTGAEDALVVNNNAAAVLLVLTSLCQNREAIVSRGELVEIGGSFRIPKVMDFGGALLKEVGTTNKTHFEDYQEGINKNTGMLVKVHSSNYVIQGFTKSIEAESLVPLAKKARIPLYYDLGSGALLDFSPYGFEEPTVKALIKAGVDILSFSGDKLLGGPQGGIILGKKKYIEKMKKNQLLRALRVDKLTLAALEATLMEYRDEKKVLLNNPTLRMLTISKEELMEKAINLLQAFKEEGLSDLPINIVPMDSLSGGGSLPDKRFPSYCLALKEISEGNRVSIGTLGEGLRKNELPIITRIKDNTLYLDLRTIKEEDFKELAKEFAKVYRSIH